MTSPDDAAPVALAYDPSADACVAFLDAATGMDADGNARTMDLRAGISAAVEVDGAALLRYLLGTLLSVRTQYALQITLESPDILALLGLTPAVATEAEPVTEKPRVLVS